MKKLIILFLLILSFSLVQASQLKVTNNHPFLINNNWIEASQLKPGDLLTTIDGKQAKITNITDIETQNPILVYNLEDSFFHNYVAGEDKVIVHNSVAESICFSGETRILMASGEEKQIKDIKPGDKVISWDFELNKTVVSVVGNASVSEHEDIYIINNKIKATGEHPFYTKEAGWASVKPESWKSKLEVGYHFMNSNGEEVRVNSIVPDFGRIKTYNLIDVGKNNNFFAENVLVHNACWVKLDGKTYETNKGKLTPEIFEKLKALFSLSAEESTELINLNKILARFNYQMNDAQGIFKAILQEHRAILEKIIYDEALEWHNIMYKKIAVRYSLYMTPSDLGDAGVAYYLDGKGAGELFSMMKTPGYQQPFGTVLRARLSPTIGLGGFDMPIKSANAEWVSKYQEALKAVAYQGAETNRLNTQNMIAPEMAKPNNEPLSRVNTLFIERLKQSRNVADPAYQEFMQEIDPVLNEIDATTSEYKTLDPQNPRRGVLLGKINDNLDSIINNMLSRGEQLQIIEDQIVYYSGQLKSGNNQAMLNRRSASAVCNANLNFFKKFASDFELLVRGYYPNSPAMREAIMMFKIRGVRAKDIPQNLVDRKLGPMPEALHLNTPYRLDVYLEIKINSIMNTPQGAEFIAKYDSEWAKIAQDCACWNKVLSGQKIGDRTLYKWQKNPQLAGIRQLYYTIQKGLSPSGLGF